MKLSCHLSLRSAARVALLTSKWKVFFCFRYFHWSKEKPKRQNQEFLQVTNDYGTLDARLTSFWSVLSTAQLYTFCTHLSWRPSGVDISPKRLLQKRLKTDGALKRLFFEHHHPLKSTPIRFFFPKRTLPSTQVTCKGFLKTWTLAVRKLRWRLCTITKSVRKHWHKERNHVEKSHFV